MKAPIIRIYKPVISLIMVGACMGLVTLACGPTAAPQPISQDKDAEGTRVAAQVNATMVSQQLTRNAPQSTPAENPGDQQSSTNSQPTYTPYPTYTVPPTATLAPTETPASNVPATTYGKPVLSTKEIGCGIPGTPTEITFTVQGMNITGMAVFYRLKDKASDRHTEWYKKDLRRSSEGRSAKITIYGEIPNPDLFVEAWLQYQIIADDGTYHSEVYGDVTVFPCLP